MWLRQDTQHLWWVDSDPLLVITRCNHHGNPGFQTLPGRFQEDYDSPTISQQVVTGCFRFFLEAFWNDVQNMNFQVVDKKNCSHIWHNWIRKQISSFSFHSCKLESWTLSKLGYLMPDQEGADLPRHKIFQKRNHSFRGQKNTQKALQLHLCQSPVG